MEPLTAAGLGAIAYILKQSIGLQRRDTQRERGYGNLESKIEGLPRHNGQPDNFAVMISGNTERRHVQNLDLANRTLQRLRFPQSNIIILDDDGAQNRPYAVDGPATMDAAKRVFGALSEKVDRSDFLFVYTTGHGHLRRGASVLATHGEPLDQHDLGRMLRGVTAKKGVLVFDQCYGGGFAMQAGSDRYTTVSASAHDEVSHDNTWPQAFFKAFSDVMADRNGDGAISVKEAYEHARNHCRYSRARIQQPLIFGRDSLIGV